MQYIKASELKLKMDNGESVVLLDIREPYEHEVCSIGGLQIPMDDVVGKVEEIPNAEMIVVMCRSGKRAEALANLLHTEFEMKNIAILEGGLLGWKEEVDNSLDID